MNALLVLGICLTAFPLAFIGAVILSILGDSKNADMQVMAGLWIVITACILGPYFMWLAV